MKHACVSAFLCLFTFFHLFSQSKDTYIIGHQVSDVRALPDGGFLMAGYLGTDSLWVSQYNQNHERVRHHQLYTRDSFVSANQELISVRAILLPNGSIACLTYVFECDVIFASNLFAIQPDGSIGWLQRNLQTYGITDLSPATDTSFLGLNGPFSNSIAFDLSGQRLSAVSVTLPDVRLQLNDQRWLCALNNEVYLSDAYGTHTTALPWFSPEAIATLDTLPTGGFVAFGAQQAYLLDANLQLTATKAIPPQFQGTRLAASATGFLSVPQEDTQDLKVQTLNADFELVSEYVTTNSVASAGVFPIVPLNYFWIHDHRFYLVGSRKNNNQPKTTWILSDSVGASGTWANDENILLTNVTVGGIPTGTVTEDSWGPGTAFLYSAQFPNVSVDVKNNGTNTLNSCKVVFNGGPACGYNPFCPIGALTLTYIFENLNLAPGQSTTLNLDTIGWFCSSIGHQNFCLTINEPNGRRDIDESGNTRCLDFPNLYVRTGEPPVRSIHIAPNPASDQIRFDLGATWEDTNTEAQWFDVLGRVVLSGPAQPNNGEGVLETHSLQSGTYLLHIRNEIGQMASQIVILR